MSYCRYRVLRTVSLLWLLTGSAAAVSLVAAAAAPAGAQVTAPAAGVATLRVHADVQVSKGLIPDVSEASAAPVPYVPARQGQSVRTGQGIRTLQRSFAELDFHDKSVLRVNERTDLVVQDSPTLRNIHLGSGSVWIRVAKGVHTQIETPSATAMARGTAFEVTQELDESGLGTMSLAVLEGHVDLSVGGQIVRTLGPGESIRVGRNGSPGDVGKMDPSEMPKDAGGTGDPWYEQAAQTLGTGLGALAGIVPPAAGELAGAGGKATGATRAAATTKAAVSGGKGKSLGAKFIGAVGKAAGAVVKAAVAPLVKTAVQTGVKAALTSATGQAATNLAALKTAASVVNGLSPTEKALAQTGAKTLLGKVTGKGTGTTAADTLPTATAKPPVSAADLAAVSPEGYTGVVIDARHLAGFQRSPAPVLYGPEPGSETVYPDINHVPTPEEVQDASVVRYYRDEADARQGFVGTNPLIVKAVAAVGPGKDCARLSAEDMARLRTLDKQIHFSLTWKVGILLPAGN